MYFLTQISLLVLIFYLISPYFVLHWSLFWSSLTLEFEFMQTRYDTKWYLHLFFSLRPVHLQRLARSTCCSFENLCLVTPYSRLAAVFYENRNISMTIHYKDMFGAIRHILIQIDMTVVCTYNISLKQIEEYSEDVTKKGQNWKLKLFPTLQMI